MRSLPTQISRRTVLVAALATTAARASAAPAAHGEDIQAARVRCERIVGGFYARLAALGLDPRAVPSVRIAYTPLRTSYDPEARTITAPAWSQAPPSLRKQVQAWSNLLGDHGNPAGLFGDVYNGFLIAHEATHAYQADLGFWKPEADRFESEIVANRGAIAFALESSAGSAKVSHLMSLAKAALETLPSPVPIGGTEREYFNAHYDEIEASPSLHAWFEARMMLVAWDHRHEMGFAAMMANLKQAAPTS